MRHLFAIALFQLHTFAKCWQLLSRGLKYAILINTGVSVRLLKLTPEKCPVDGRILISPCEFSDVLGTHDRTKTSKKGIIAAYIPVFRFPSIEVMSTSINRPGKPRFQSITNGVKLRLRSIIHILSSATGYRPAFPSVALLRIPYTHLPS